METQQKTEEEEEEDIRLLLLDDDANLPEAMERLYQLTKRKTAGFLDWKHPTLMVEDQISALHDAYIELEKKLRNGTVDLNLPLPPLLFVIANCRAIDLVRKRNRKNQPTLQFEEEEIMDSFTAFDWRKKKRRGETREILEEIRLEISKSSGLTKAVGEALLHLVPPEPSPEEIKEAVEEIIGKPTTLSSVSSTLSRLRKNLRHIIQG